MIIYISYCENKRQNYIISICKKLLPHKWMFGNSGYRHWTEVQCMITKRSHTCSEYNWIGTTMDGSLKTLLSTSKAVVNCLSSSKWMLIWQLRANELFTHLNSKILQVKKNNCQQVFHNTTFFTVNNILNLSNSFSIHFWTLNKKLFW